MIRQYRFCELMQLLNSKSVFVMRNGERYFFARIVE